MKLNSWLKIYCRWLLKGLVYGILLLCFVFLYFKSQLEQLMKGGTTFSKRYEEVNDYDMPVHIICMEPGIKKKESAKYGYPLLPNYIFYDPTEKYKEFNLTEWQMYSELTYKQFRDFNVSYKHDIFGNFQFLNETTRLEQTGFEVKVFPIATIHRGMCHAIKPKYHWHFGNDWSLRFTFDPETIPKGLKVYVASDSTWYGLSVEDWPYFNLGQEYISWDTSVIPSLGLKPSKTYFQNGQENVLTCLQKLIKAVNCSYKCHPATFNQITDLPPCRNRAEHQCVTKEVSYRKYDKYINCLKPKIATHYEIFSIKRPQLVQQTLSMELQFFLTTNQLEIREEILTYSVQQFIGSVGGSLGLFLGFSFYSYIAFLVEALVQAFIKNTSL